MLIVCCYGLTGLPDAIATAWPKAIVQTCVVHLIRNSMRYATWKDRKVIAAGLRPIYTAATAQAAEQALDLTLAEAADALDCSLLKISRIERGHVRDSKFVTTYRTWLNEQTTAQMAA